MRFHVPVAFLSVVLLGGFTPLDNYFAAEAAAKAACAKLLGNTLSPDLDWGGTNLGTKPDSHWEVWGARHDNPNPAGPKDFYVDLPRSGAGPNKCVKNPATPESRLVVHTR